METLDKIVTRRIYVTLWLCVTGGLTIGRTITYLWSDVVQSYILTFNSPVSVLICKTDQTPPCL